MTAKSRRRKLGKKLREAHSSTQIFRFNHGNHDISVRAENEEHAKQIFQDTYGHRPESA